MKSWRTRMTYGLAVVAAAVAIPMTAGSASAADWKNMAGGPEMYPTMAECHKDEPLVKERMGFGETMCDDDNGYISLWAR